MICVDVVGCVTVVVVEGFNNLKTNAFPKKN